MPSPIEDKFAGNTLIEQLCIVGLGMPQPLGLIRLSEFCNDMAEDVIKNSLLESLKKANDELHRHETIQKLICISDVWSVENGMLTPTMKIKRNVIHDTYAHHYDNWYKQEETVILL